MSKCDDEVENPDEDLIDFEIGSTVLSTSGTTCNINESSSSSSANDNLLDSELPILEIKLQNAPPQTDTKTINNNNNVDVEDILISIDEDVIDGINNTTNDFIDEFSHIDVFSLNNTNDVIDNEERDCSTSSGTLSNTEILMELYSGNCLDNTNSFDYDEALAILMKLDEILNDTLRECNRFLNGSETGSDISYDKEEESIEDCLMDLDNYLNELETSDIIEDGHQQQQIKNDDNKRMLSDNLLCLVSKLPETELFKRNHVNRSTITLCHEVDRKKFTRDCKFRKSMITCSTMRASGPGVDLEEIDWGSVRKVAHDVMVERQAHASGMCCTGSVTVEHLHNEDNSSMSPCREEMESPESHRTSNDTNANVTNTWLRSSMRRLQHFRLPSDVDDDNTNIEQSSTEIDLNIQHDHIVTTMMDSNNETPLPTSTTNGLMTNDLTTNGLTTNTPVSSTSSPTPSNIVRPVSAPGRITTTTQGRQRRCCIHHHHHNNNNNVTTVPCEVSDRNRSSSASSRSRRHRSLSSSVTSLASSVDSTPSPIPTVGQDNQEANSTTNRSCDRQRSATEVPEMESPLGQWPHGLSSMLACLGCTLGLFNICRFAILSIHFGANFIFQFFILSFVIGLPMLTLQSALGQQLGAGVIDMWRISPLFQGVGFSLLISQALIGLYSIIGISWMFVYFRDSFITKMDKYRWAEPFYYYRNGVKITENSTYKLSETIPDYLSGVVLQRHHLASGQANGTIKFQSAFNLAVVWMIVFVSLSKGLRSYGKVIYVFTLLPVFGTFILCAKLLGMMPHEFINVIFPETNWSEFFLNSKSWLAAAQEVFLTWGTFGAAIMQLASHNKYKHMLQRDSSLITVITFTILLLVAFLANTCVQILKSYGYTYLPDSFEKISTYVFMRPTKEPLPPSLASVPVRYMFHNSFICGDRVTRPGMDLSTESGYQVLRFATELVPATFALLGSDNISPFWAILFYFILILFGIAQQLAIWHCLITGIMAIKAKMLKSWETTITFFSCACGFIFGLPMTTEFGIYMVYFMDLTVGGSWWLILIIVLQIIAVFMVRGRPYTGDTVVTALFTSPGQSCFSTWAPALLSFTWNVILPVSLMILCITIFKNGNFRELFVWHHAPTVEYWPLWARQIGSMLQLLPILFIPLIAVIQSYRYLNNGPPDILDRIQLLYRPPIGGEQIEDYQVREIAEATITQSNATTNSNAPAEDPPPKYTPPPSYTTATGARIAKLLRQSIRQSMRRLANVLGESSGGSRQRQNQSQQTQQDEQPPPPDYNAVLVEMNQNNNNNNNSGNNASNNQTVVNIDVTDSGGGNNNIITTSNNNNHNNNNPSVMTATDVARILRNSFRRSARRAVNTLMRANVTDSNMSSLSAENLVASAAPIGETSLVLEAISDDCDDKTNDLNSVIQ